MDHGQKGLAIRRGDFDQFLGARLIGSVGKRRLAEDMIPLLVVGPGTRGPENQGRNERQPEEQPCRHTSQKAEVPLPQGINEQKRRNDLETDAAGEPESSTQ